jgi:hypothetical protein
MGFQEKSLSDGASVREECAYVNKLRGKKNKKITNKQL